MPTLYSGFCTFHFMRWVKRVSVVIAVTCSLNVPVFADTRALPDGQANIAGHFENFILDLSSVANADDQRYGLRFSTPVLFKHAVLFIDAQGVQASSGDIAFGNEVDASGLAAGAGIYFTDLLPDLDNLAINFRLSGQREQLDVDSYITVSGIQAETEIINRSFSAAFLLSPVMPLFANGTNTYLTLGVGYQRSERKVRLNDRDQQSLYRSNQEYVPQVAIGIVRPLNYFSFYASVEYEQEFALGLGIRLRVSNLGH